MNRFRKVALIAFGVAIVAAVALAGAWLLILIATYVVPAFKNAGHQEFARTSVSSIKPAAQMDALFSDCRHYITYAGEPSGPAWNSVAYFGGRYELTMQVPVTIRSRTDGEVTGDPAFYLAELSSVRIGPGGSVGAQIGEYYELGEDEWQQVYDSGGDFGAIGISLEQTPVPNFDRYAAATRGSEEQN